MLEIVPVAGPADSVAAMLDPANGQAAGPLMPARVKWFDRVKGFGFVNVYGKADDVFLHMETLRQFGYGEVVAGDVLAVRITAGPRGPMVYEVRSWDYVARHRERRCASETRRPRRCGSPRSLALVDLRARPRRTARPTSPTCATATPRSASASRSPTTRPSGRRA